MSRYARGEEHTIYGTTEKVWITPLLGEEIAKIGEDGAPDMSSQAVISRHTFTTAAPRTVEFDSPEQVLEELDWQQMDDLAGAILTLSGLGKEVAAAESSFQGDGDRPVESVEPAPDGREVQPAA